MHGEYIYKCLPITLSILQILVQMCQILIQPATIIFAGHLGSKLALDTVALGQTVSNMINTCSTV